MATESRAGLWQEKTRDAALAVDAGSPRFFAFLFAPYWDAYRLSRYGKHVLFPK
jgi:hypothetical protein